jgi:hypothetical protein
MTPRAQLRAILFGSRRVDIRTPDFEVRVDWIDCRSSSFTAGQSGYERREQRRARTGEHNRR